MSSAEVVGPGLENIWSVDRNIRIGKVALPMHITAVKRRSLVEEVSSRLAEAIRRGAPNAEGLLSSERELATQFGVSRPVVREATKRLELQGLIEVRQGIGIRVTDRLHTPISAAARLLLPDEAERLRKSLEIRAILEPEIARRAAERANEAGLAKLREVHSRLELADSLEAAMDADMAFHAELARLSGNEIFSLLLDTIADLGRESRRATMTQAGLKPAIHHHAAVFKAIERGDGEAAEKAMRFHMEVAHADLQPYLSTLPRSVPER